MGKAQLMIKTAASAADGSLISLSAALLSLFVMSQKEYGKKRTKKMKEMKKMMK